MGNYAKGVESYLYVDIGEGSPSWQEVDVCRDINIADSKAEISDLTRAIAQEGNESTRAGLRTIEITFDCLRPAEGESANDAYDELINAYKTDIDVEVIISDAAKTGSGVPATKYNCAVFNTSAAQPLNDNDVTSFTLKIHGTNSIVEGTFTAGEFEELGS